MRHTATSNLATTDIKGFFCPTPPQRDCGRALTTAMMLSSQWTGGGTDYGGCAGRHAAFTPQDRLQPLRRHDVLRSGLFARRRSERADDTRRPWGIFGRINVSTKFGEIRDGLSNTIMTGELQRITATTPSEQGRLGDRRPGHALHHRRDVRAATAQRCRWHRPATG